MSEFRLKTKSNEVKDNGIVSIVVSAFGNVDSDGDVLVSGAFTKTLNENGKRIKHLLNHNVDFLIGCPISANETNSNLVFESALNLDTEIGRNVYSNYKLYQKHGKTLEHSIGYEDVKRNPMDEKQITEAKLWEISTLYGWAANEKTPLLDLKSMGFKSNGEAFQFLHDALKLKFSDNILETYEAQLRLLEKAINEGSRLVKCECGLEFDYNSRPEHKIKDEIRRMANDVMYEYVNSTVWGEISINAEDIRNQVREILSKGIDINDERLNYVVCPVCGRRIYRSEVGDGEGVTILHKNEKMNNESKEGGEPSDDTLKESRKPGTFSLQTIGGLLK